jgi:hypothetical protein
MDASKILSIGSAVVLSACLILSIIGLTRIEESIDQNRALQAEQDSMLEILENQTNETEPTPEDNTVSIPTATPDSTATGGYRIQSVGEKIGVYTSDGRLVRLIDVNPATLPRIDREALENGITVDSWERALAYLSDYTA